MATPNPMDLLVYGEAKARELARDRELAEQTKHTARIADEAARQRRATEAAAQEAARRAADAAAQAEAHQRQIEASAARQERLLQEQNALLKQGQEEARLARPADAHLLMREWPLPLRDGQIVTVGDVERWRKHQRAADQRAAARTTQAYNEMEATPYEHVRIGASPWNVFRTHGDVQAIIAAQQAEERDAPAQAALAQARLLGVTRIPRAIVRSMLVRLVPFLLACVIAMGMPIVGFVVALLMLAMFLGDDHDLDVLNPAWVPDAATRKLVPGCPPLAVGDSPTTNTSTTTTKPTWKPPRDHAAIALAVPVCWLAGRFPMALWLLVPALAFTALCLVRVGRQVASERAVRQAAVAAAQAAVVAVQGRSQCLHREAEEWLKAHPGQRRTPRQFHFTPDYRPYTGGESTWVWDQEATEFETEYGRAHAWADMLHRRWLDWEGRDGPGTMPVYRPDERQADVPNAAPDAPIMAPSSDDQPDGRSESRLAKLI